MRHPTAETLLDRLEEKLASPESGVVDAHVSSCGRCQESAAGLRMLTAFLETDRRDEPPDALLAWAAGLFQPVRRPSAAGSEGRVRRIARRIFDSFTQPSPAGVRHVGHAGAAARQLLYRAGDVDIDLRIESSGRKLSVTGQVLAAADSFPDNAPVWLESSGTARFETRTNPVGEFSFDEIPADTYHLSVDLPQGQVTLFCVHRNDARLS